MSAFYIVLIKTDLDIKMLDSVLRHKLLCDRDGAVDCAGIMSSPVVLGWAGREPRKRTT